MLAALLDLVLPRSCAGCRAPGGALCPPCRGLLLADPLGPVRPTPCPAGLPPVRALSSYDGPLQRLLLAHKEHAALHLSRPLGEALGRVVSGFGEAVPVLCPAPSSRAAVRARGYDHTGRLAVVAARALRAAGRPAAVRHLLVPARAVRDQAGLHAAERTANLHGALVARGGPPLRVVLVDDVVTTGATLVEAARALAAAGHEVAGAAVLGATRRRMSSGRVNPLHPGTVPR